MPTVVVRDGVHAKTGSGKAIVYLSDEERLQYEADANITKSDIRKAINVVEDHLADCWAMWRKYHP